MGTDNVEGGTFLPEDASSRGALDAYVEELPQGIAVQIVTLGCADECASVKALATGGNPPYAFAWSDGVGSQARNLCPKATTAYEVTVTDTGTTGEFAHATQSVTVPLTADVLSSCPDGGSAMDGGSGGCGGANAVCWTTWTSNTVGTPGSATGTITTPAGTVSVTYAGEVALQTAVNLSSLVNWYTPVSTYTCATVSDPPPADGMIFQAGGTGLVDSLTFSQPVKNPVFAIVSLGNSIDSTQGEYEFGAYGEPFTILKDGPGSMAGSGVLTDVDGGLVGDDGDGLVQLLGTFTTIRWTDPIQESSGGHGFTVGIPSP